LEARQESGALEEVHSHRDQIDFCLDMAQLSKLGEKGKSPLPVLRLNQEALLNTWQRRFAYHCIHSGARFLPALVIFGGTLGIIICAVYKYRWGVLFSLTLFTFYTLKSSMVYFVCAIYGVFKVYMAQGTNWYEKYCRLKETEQTKAQEERWGLTAEEMDSGLCWHDVIHIVMVPTYETPMPVLRDTLNSIAQFSLAHQNLGICMAFEAREVDTQQKFEILRKEFEDHFRFMLPTFHPPNLPDHLPGKSSNECWAFSQLCRMLDEDYGISRFDPRVVITVVDDDSNMHENYFEALTYHFLAAKEKDRYLTTWQPPVCHFKNYLRQPIIVRLSAIQSGFSELGGLASSYECHVPFSSYSLSLVLASSVGGWDPDFLAEDWHMFAKCSLMAEGRNRCVPIFLPMLNYTPEDESYWGTLRSRWAQARRHALGVSELVYVLSHGFLAVLELPSMKRVLVFMWRVCPMLGKMAEVHFTNGVGVTWYVLAQIVIHGRLWRSWCYIEELDEPNGICDQVVISSWLVWLQTRASLGIFLTQTLAPGTASVYFHLVKERVEGDLDSHWRLKYIPVMWLSLVADTVILGFWSGLFFGAVPLWIACVRIVRSVRFSHVVAGMLGRPADATEV